MDDQADNPAEDAAPDESSEQRVDIASLERDIDNLMSTARSERPGSGDDGGVSQVDLLLREINELLAHETNSLLNATNGLLGKTLESIFDPKILANKHQKIDKALAQALAKGKAGAAAAPVKAPVTNPAPRFAGISRPMTADLSKTGLKTAAAPKVASGPREALPKPEEEAPGEIKFGEAPKGDTGAFTTRIEEAPPESEPVVTIEEAKPTVEKPPQPEPVAEAPPAPAPAAAAPAPAPAPAPKPAEKPKAEAPPKEAPAAPAEVPDFPQPLILRILAFPMKLVPESARLAVSAVALTMLFSAPVAWVFAHRAVTTQGIGPIDFSMLEEQQAEAEAAAKDAAKDAAAKDAAAKDAGHADAKKDDSQGGGKH
jgi:hypothetical protein